MVFLFPLSFIYTLLVSVSILSLLNRLIKESRYWRCFTSLKLFFSSLYQCSPYNSVLVFYPVLNICLTKTSGSWKVAWPPSHSHKHFHHFLSSFSSCHHAYMYTFILRCFVKKTKKKTQTVKVGPTIISLLPFFLVLSWKAYPPPPRASVRVCSFDAHMAGGEVKMPVVISESANFIGISRRFSYIYSFFSLALNICSREIWNHKIAYSEGKHWWTKPVLKMVCSFVSNSTSSCSCYIVW